MEEAETICDVHMQAVTHIPQRPCWPRWRRRWRSSAPAGWPGPRSPGQPAGWPAPSCPGRCPLPSYLGTDTDANTSGHVTVATAQQRLLEFSKLGICVTLYMPAWNRNEGWVCVCPPPTSWKAELRMSREQMNKYRKPISSSSFPSDTCTLSSFPPAPRAGRETERQRERATARARARARERERERERERGVAKRSSKLCNWEIVALPVFNGCSLDTHSKWYLVRCAMSHYCLSTVWIIAKCFV